MFSERVLYKKVYIISNWCHCPLSSSQDLMNIDQDTMDIEKILKFRFDSLTMHVQRFLRQSWDDLGIFLVLVHSYV